MRDDFHKLAYKQKDGPTDFVEFGRPILESEDLTDSVYSAMVAMLKSGFSGARGEVKIDDFGRLYRHGAYLPCERRVALVGQFDMSNDSLPDFSAMVDVSDSGASFYTARRVKKLPIGTAPLKTGDKYRVSAIYEDGNDLGAILHYITVTQDGEVCHCINRHHVPYAAAMSYFVARSSMSLTAHADSRFLWNVRAAEKLIGNHETPITLGVGQEAVKSLFYARETPLTETGRKRPILHWVRAHQRRIKEGVDVDVSKHLRGITKFEMHGLNLEITSPIKPRQNDSATPE